MLYLKEQLKVLSFHRQPLNALAAAVYLCYFRPDRFDRETIRETWNEQAFNVACNAAEVLLSEEKTGKIDQQRQDKIISKILRIEKEAPH